MAKTIPMIITNNNILVKDKESDAFVPFEMPGVEHDINIPFYHQFAAKIAESQRHFKLFINSIYGKKYSKNILAIIVPDDTSPLEAIFIKEFFLNSGCCKGVAQMTMGQALSKEDSKYISLSRSSRNIILQYINNNEIKAKKYYDVDEYDVATIHEDAKRIHIDVEYTEVPIYINNFNMNMDDFSSIGTVISTKDFMAKIAVVDVEKL
ncbi:MAG: hypothetical protein IJ168_06400 [Eubacterium sp.]|nr:hypothetical protein [Eubacterium sp.]